MYNCYRFTAELTFGHELFKLLAKLIRGKPQRTLQVPRVIAWFMFGFGRKFFRAWRGSGLRNLTRLLWLEPHLGLQLPHQNMQRNQNSPTAKHCPVFRLSFRTTLNYTKNTFSYSCFQMWEVWGLTGCCWKKLPLGFLALDDAPVPPVTQLQFQD